MKFKKHLSADILKPFIKSFMIIESERKTENRILPDTSLVMAFRFRGNVALAREGSENTLPVSLVSGLMKSPRLLTYSERTAAFLVTFHEGGAAAFFKEPLQELFGASISLDNLIRPNKVREIEERLAGASNTAERISTVERFLLSELKRTQPDNLILNAVQKIKRAKGNIRIGGLAKELHISHDPFEKRFRKIIGATPKRFSAIVRLRNLINEHSQRTSLIDEVYAAGYFDQPHFIKDFKSFTGQTPTDFFKSPPRW